MIRRIFQALFGALAVTAVASTPAFGGNIALTGHDDDFHAHFDGSSCTIADDACTQLSQLIAFVRAGSSSPTLPVLTFDQLAGDAAPLGELTTALTGLGIPFTNISTAAGVTDALFDPTVYSAFIVASDSTCGGCDNNPAMTVALTAHSAAIADFFNKGGGVIGLAGGTNAGTYYGFLPVSAVGSGSPPSSGFVATGPCFGTAVTAVNGDATHNYFANPGTGGVSPLFCVAETNPSDTSPGPHNTTLLLQGGRIVTSVITSASVPEPATLSLLALGGLAAAYRRRRRA